MEDAYGAGRRKRIAVASNGRARELLGWQPERSDIEIIVADAWAARQSLR